MPEKKQFTLSWLLIEISLIGFALAFGRLMFVQYSLEKSTYVDGLMRIVCVPKTIVLSGAAIGGLFGRFKEGHVGGVIVVFTWLIVFAPPLR